ncbi:TetR/AcrR family transcriptional regulator [Nocardia sp. NPDC059239]|uniref:TetR/AcrR family transcriptional regulator n=1 Tax=unclassified Nocardia TaxID=2637762 RepID=UPI0036B82657
MPESPTARSRRSNHRYRPKGMGAVLITEAATRAFAERGFHGVSIRELADGADVSLSTFYWFYPSKQDVLFAVIDEALRGHLKIISAAMAEATDDPVAQLDAFVGAVVEYRARHSLESLLLNETRNLSPEMITKLDEAHGESRRLLSTIINAGIATGTFTTPYPDDARRAIIAMCNAIPRWYDADSSIAVPELVARHRDLARALVGAEAPTRPSA